MSLMKLARYLTNEEREEAQIAPSKLWRLPPDSAMESVLPDDVARLHEVAHTLSLTWLGMDVSRVVHSFPAPLVEAVVYQATDTETTCVKLLDWRSEDGQSRAAIPTLMVDSWLSVGSATTYLRTLLALEEGRR